MGIPEPKPAPVIVSRSPSNSLGVAGVIVSTVGLLTCGLLSPIGLLFSLLGLLKAPRGAALAGTVIGAFGTLLLGIIGISFIGLLQAIGPGFESIRDAFVGLGGSVSIKQYYDQHGQLPDDATGQQELTKMLGELAGDVQYRQVDDQQFEIRLLGPDRVWDTADDRIYKYNVQAWENDGAPPPNDGEPPAGQVEAEQAAGVEQLLQ